METAENRGTLGNVEEARQFFRSRYAADHSENGSHSWAAYTIAAWIRGEEGEGTAKDKKADDKEAAKKDAKKDGKADEKSKKPVVKKPLNVIYVADIDLINNQLLGMRTEGVGSSLGQRSLCLEPGRCRRGENRYLDNASGSLLRHPPPDRGGSPGGL